MTWPVMYLRDVDELKLSVPLLHTPPWGSKTISRGAGV